MPTAGGGESAPQVLDDRVAVDRVADRLAHLEALQHRIPQVQADVGVVGPGPGGDLQLPLALHLPDDVGRDVVDDEIDGALAQLESAHRVVGHDLQDDAGVLRRPFEVAVEAARARSDRPA